MPHAKPSSAHVRSAESAGDEPSRVGAIVVAAISGSLLGAVMLFARPERTSLTTLTEPALSTLRRVLGFEARPFEVVSDSQLTQVTPSTAVGGPRVVVAGRVLDADGNPVAGSAVRVQAESRPGWDWVTSSGSDGSFQVDGVAAGRVHVAAQDIEAGFVESTMLEPNEAHQVVLVFNRTVELTGTILDARGAPIARAAVKFVGKSGAPDRVVIANDDGRFTVRGAAHGGDRIIVWARGFESTTITLGAVASEFVKRDVRLRAARPVRGTVVDPSGQLVAGARVSACPGKEAELATSDEAGAFELPATVIGCWLTASHPRFAGSRPTRIADGRETVVRLGAGGAIEGTAVDDHGKPMGAFSVSIASFEPEDGVRGVATRVGETAEHLRGAFRLDDLAPGTYVLRFSAEGRIDTDSGPIEVLRGRVVRGQQLTLNAAVNDDTAQPAEGLTVTGGSESAERGANTAEETTEAPAEPNTVTEEGSASE